MLNDGSRKIKFKLLFFFFIINNQGHRDLQSDIIRIWIQLIHGNSQLELTKRGFSN